MAREMRVTLLGMASEPRKLLESEFSHEPSSHSIRRFVGLRGPREAAVFARLGAAEATRDIQISAGIAEAINRFWC